MPDADTILSGLTRIANDFAPFAVLWHALLAGALAGLLAGWRPDRAVAVWLTAPLVSVSALAFGTGNLFNGVVFAALAGALGVVGFRQAGRLVMSGPPWAVALGATAIAYGWLYPHFLNSPPIAYLMAAPLGLLPCPTLAVVIGLGLVAGGFQSRAWTAIAGGAGLFYALVGVIGLGVWLDLGLLVAASGMLATLLRPVAAPRPLTV